MKITIIRILFTISILAACSPFSDTTPTPELTPAHTPTPNRQVEVTPPTRPINLLIWVPPQFDPSSGAPGGELFQSRLDEFAVRRPNVRVEIRVKAERGPGSLLDALTTASAAAPLALPDLVALPRSILETAALKGLLYTFEPLTETLNEDDWYEYARQLGYLQNTTYGIPFAGDALVTLYRPAAIERPPQDWESTLVLAGPLAFPAADEEALYTLIQYVSAGGQVLDAEGRPTLDASVLTEVLTFYRALEQGGIMPFWLTQYTTDEQTWDAYVENRANMVITWISRYLRELPADTAASPIPTNDGRPFTFANGWVWSLANPNVDRHEMAIELAEFLTMGDYLGDWTFEAGYMPPRSSAVQRWPDSSLRNLVDQVARSSSIIPPADVITAISPALLQATVEVLKEQDEPAVIAQNALQRLTQP